MLEQVGTEVCSSPGAGLVTPDLHFFDFRSEKYNFGLNILDCYFYHKPNACCSHQVSVLSMIGNVPIRLLFQVPNHMNDSVCTPVVVYGTLSQHQQSLTLMLPQIANSY